MRAAVASVVALVVMLGAGPSAAAPVTPDYYPPFLCQWLPFLCDR